MNSVRTYGEWSEVSSTWRAVEDATDTVIFHMSDLCVPVAVWDAAVSEDSYREHFGQTVPVAWVECECGEEQVPTESKFERWAHEADETLLPGTVPATFDRSGMTLAKVDGELFGAFGQPATRHMIEWAQGTRDGKNRAEDVIRQSIRELSPESAANMLGFLSGRYNVLARTVNFRRSAQAQKIAEAMRQLRNVVRYGKDAIAPVIEHEITELSDDALLKDATEAARQAWREGYRLGRTA